MATQTQTQIYCAGSNIHQERNFRGGPEQPLYVEAASQSWLAGDLIYMNGTSNMTLCGVNGSNQSNTQIGGQAKTNATGVTGAAVHCFAIRPDDEFFANVYHSSAGSALSSKAQIGTARALVRINGIWMVDIENAVEGSNNSLARVLVTDIPSRVNGVTNTAGDTYGFVVCQFLPITLSLTGTLAASRVLQFCP